MTYGPNERLAALRAAGVSIWLDDLDRERIRSGGLADLVQHWSVSGVTTNPSIFQQAVAKNAHAYGAQLGHCAQVGMDADTTIRQLTTDDVRSACDVLRPTWETSSGKDGLVSIEVDPRLANDTQGTVAAAVDLWQVVDRPNAMIKIPATAAGIPAIAHVLGEGISVNVTLIFSVSRYRDVMAAHRDGLQRALTAGHDITRIESVASFFVSRVDSLVDAQLTRLGAEHLRGRAAVANARLAWEAFRTEQLSDAWTELAARGASAQRPLWASTGVKDPAYPDTLYVSALVGFPCVNTMPEATMQAFADHGAVPTNTLDGTAGDAEQVWDTLASVGIDANEVFSDLERDGVEKFIASWEQLRATVTDALGR